MPRLAPPRVRNLPQLWLRTLRSMRRSSVPGWTSMLPSTESWRPLTTKCPDTEKSQSIIIEFVLFLNVFFLLYGWYMVLFLSINVLCRTEYNVFIQNHAKIFKNLCHRKSFLRNRIIKNGGFF